MITVSWRVCVISLKFFHSQTKFAILTSKAFLSDTNKVMFTGNWSSSVQFVNAELQYLVANAVKKPTFDFDIRQIWLSSFYLTSGGSMISQREAGVNLL